MALAWAQVDNAEACLCNAFLLQIIPDSQAGSLADVPWFNRSPRFTRDDAQGSRDSTDKLKVAIMTRAQFSQLFWRGIDDLSTRRRCMS